MERWNETAWRNTLQTKIEMTEFVYRETNGKLGCFGLFSFRFVLFFGFLLLLLLRLFLSSAFFSVFLSFFLVGSRIISSFWFYFLFLCLWLVVCLFLGLLALPKFAESRIILSLFLSI